MIEYLVNGSVNSPVQPHDEVLS